jgi:hypothetical protein
MQVAWRFGMAKELLREQTNRENSYLFSNALREHVSRGLGGDSCMFRVGSRAFVEMFAEIRMLSEAGAYVLNEQERFLVEETELGEWGRFDGSVVPLDIPMVEGDEDEHPLNEAEYQGKKVQLGKPKRGGSKKFYVYVNAGKNKDGSVKVKKVSWGYPGMSVKISDPERRKNFAARHRCTMQKDKTTAAYWACRTARYPHLTGAKKSYTWW